VLAPVRGAGARAAAQPRLAALLVAILVGVLAWAVLVSSLAGVRRVQVAGDTGLPAGAVAAAAAVRPGTPLARVDLDAVHERVAALPRVAAVEVDRRWPSTVEVRVRQRIAVAAVRTRAGAVLVDRTGFAFASEPTMPATLPELVVARHEPGDPRTRAALDVLVALPAGLRAQVRQVEVPSRSAVSLRLAGGKTVVWGHADDSERKARVLAALIRQPGSRYDVSSPPVVTVR